MASTGKRLAALTAGLVLPDDVAVQEQPPAQKEGGEPGYPAVVDRHTEDTQFPPARAPERPRTGPGQMLAFRGQMQAVEGELAGLREKLRNYDGAMPSRRLDPKSVRPSHWANRHQASFDIPAFARLKSDIEKSGGNVQPILVRKIEGSETEFELVFGHRRHHACLELGIPVLACIWDGVLTDQELFTAMDRENREREDLSPYEQGVMYQRALEEQLFPTQRKLADHLGVSHTWVRKTLVVAQLPAAIVSCFRSPLEISHRHAEKLHTALEREGRAVLKRAEKLRGAHLSAGQVVDRLLLGDESTTRSERMSLEVGKVRLGKAVQSKDGTVTIELSPEGLAAMSTSEALQAIEGILLKLRR